MKLKLIDIESCLNILNPILQNKCRGIFAWELMNLINELEPELEKIAKVKQKLIEEYGIKDEDGNYKVNKVNDVELVDFGENSQIVEEEMKELLETEFEIKNKLSKDLLNHIEIEPIALKFLYDRSLIV